VGPLLGGGLAQSLGWRSTFVAMAVCGTFVFVALLVFMEEVSIGMMTTGRIQK
jgi:predicted MFS family arabinose efflux permease